MTFSIGNLNTNEKLDMHFEDCEDADVSAIEISEGSNAVFAVRDDDDNEIVSLVLDGRVYD